MPGMETCEVAAVCVTLVSVVQGTGRNWSGSIRFQAGSDIRMGSGPTWAQKAANLRWLFCAYVQGISSRGQAVTMAAQRSNSVCLENIHIDFRQQASNIP